MDNINLIINKKRPSSQIDNLQVGNKNLQQPVTISNGINTYFRNIPTELASKLPTTNRRFSHYMKRKKGKFHFNKVNEVEVFLFLENIDTRKSIGVEVHPLLPVRWKYLNH